MPVGSLRRGWANTPCCCGSVSGIHTAGTSESPNLMKPAVIDIELDDVPVPPVSDSLFYSVELPEVHYTILYRRSRSRMFTVTNKPKEGA